MNLLRTVQLDLRRLRGGAVAGLVVLVSVVGGCSQGRVVSSQPAESADQQAAALKRQRAMAGTIGEVAFLRGNRWLAVRGYGLVVGLGRNGSRDCPRPLRRYMLQEIRKHLRAGGIYQPGEVQVSATRLLESLDTAVVEVTGLIPPGAARAARFDVRVRAVEGTNTRSLEGGRLYTCRLHIYAADTRRGVVQGRAVATAAGPIFQNPFAASGRAATAVDPREGFVLGGGFNLVPRRMELVLVQPSYRLARQVMDRINERFGAGLKIADAVSEGLIYVQAPESWRNREDRFYALVMHLPLSRDESFLLQRAKVLIGYLAEPDPVAEDIALILEAMGQVAVEAVQEHYTDRNRLVRFYCARVGLRLRDDAAVDVLAAEALDPNSPFRLAAIRELGDATDVALARLPLRRLLDDRDAVVRLAAYEGLHKHRDEKISAVRVGSDNFTLEIVDCGGEPLIYATRSMEPRIAIFGRGLRCEPPVFYMHPEKIVAVTADAGDTQLTVVRRTPFAKVSEPLKVSLDVADLIRFLGEVPEPDEETGRIKGVGLLYSQVLDVIWSLCRSGAIPARFEIQKAPVAELLGPAVPLGRPESEIK